MFCCFCLIAPGDRLRGCGSWVWSDSNSATGNPRIGRCFGFRCFVSVVVSDCEIWVLPCLLPPFFFLFLYFLFFGLLWRFWIWFDDGEGGPASVIAMEVYGEYGSVVAADWFLALSVVDGVGLWALEMTVAGMAELKIEDCCLENKQLTAASNSSLSDGSASATLKSPAVSSPATTSPSHRYGLLKSNCCRQ